MKDAMVSVRMSGADKEKLQAEAARLGVSMSSLIVMVLREYLRGNNK